MAHLPRWGGSDVDSQAMVSAYLHWISKAEASEAEALLPYLWMVNHRNEWGPPPSPPRAHGRDIPTRPCSEEGCQRCHRGEGGYQFRWIDSRWLDQYENMWRPGSVSFRPSTDSKVWFPLRFTA